MLFQDRVNRAIERAEGRGKLFGLLFINLDRFQLINDHYGHTAGDKVLVNVTARLSSIMRADDSMARFGGDEFCHLFLKKTIVRKKFDRWSRRCKALLKIHSQFDDA